VDAGTKMAQPFVWFPSSPHLTNHFLRPLTSGLLEKTVAPTWVKTFIVVQQIQKPALRGVA